MNDEKKRFNINKWMYPLGTVGRDMVYQLFNSFILTYILLTRNLDAAQFAAITGIMIGARVFDALNDPLMGFIIEKTRTKWGKFKPWIVIGMITTAAIIITIFNTTLTGWNFVILFGVIYFLYSISYTMHDIAYWGMIPSLSSDASARNLFTSRATLFAGLGVVVASVFIPMYAYGNSSITGNVQTSFGLISIVVCALALIFVCFTVFGVKENREEYKNKQIKRKGIKDIVKTVVTNKPLLWVTIAFIFQQVGNGLIAGGFGQNYIIFKYGYEGGKYSLFSTIGLAATAVLMVLYPSISRKINRKPLMKKMLLVSIVGYALMLLTAVIPNQDLSFKVIIAGYTLSNFGQYGFYLVMMISILNTVEYNEYISGDRDEAVIASVRPFVTKLASALIIGITSLVYIILDVLGITNGISAIENEFTKANGAITEATKNQQIADLIAGIPESIKTSLLIAMVVIPLVLMLISHFIYQKKYSLEEKEYDRIVKELEERKAK